MAPPRKCLSPCNVAGVCLHSGMGRYLGGLVARIGAWLRRVAPAKSKTRSLLDSGQVVLRWDVAGTPTRYMHIGLMYWGPTRPTFLEMTERPAQVFELEPGALCLRPVVLNNAARCWTLPRFAESLASELAHEVSARFMVLVDEVQCLPLEMFTP